MALNLQCLQGHWDQLKVEVKKKWAQLTDDDLHWTDGDVDHLFGRIQERTGESREAVESFFDHLTCEGSSAFAHAVEAVGHAASHATNRIREGYLQVAESARGRYGEARDVVGRKPMHWVAAAFGVGFVAGMFAGYTSMHTHQPPPRRFF